MNGDHKNKNTNRQLELTEPNMVDDDRAPAPTNDAVRRGATMVEYALLLVFVLLAALLSLKVFGETLVAVFETSADTVQTAPNVGP